MKLISNKFQISIDFFQFQLNANFKQRNGNLLIFGIREKIKKLIPRCVGDRTDHVQPSLIYWEWALLRLKYCLK